MGLRLGTPPSVFVSSTLVHQQLGVLQPAACLAEFASHLLQPWLRLNIGWPSIVQRNQQETLPTLHDQMAPLPSAAPGACKRPGQ